MPIPVAVESLDSPNPGPDPRMFKYVPVRLLVIDPRIERTITTASVDRIYREWDWNKAEALTVAPLPEGFYSVDEGQHRTLAARRFGPDFELPCMIVFHDEATEEPELAYGISTSRRPHSSYDKLKLRYHSHEPYALTIIQTLRDHGLQAGAHRSGRTIAAVAALDQIVRYDHRTPDEGGELLSDVLQCILASHPSDDPERPGSRFDRHFLNGIAQVLRRNEHCNLDRLTTVLKGRQPSAWIIGRDVERQPWEGFGIALVQAYNRKIKASANRLSW